MPTPRDALRTPNLTARKALDAALTELEGVTDDVADVLKRTLQVETIQDLAESPYFGFADEVTKALAAPRHVYRRFGVPADRVVKGWEEKPPTEIAEANLSALEGVGEPRRKELEKALGVTVVRELADWQPFLQARELLQEAKRGGGVRSKSAVEGRIVTPRATPSAGSIVRLYHKGFGDERVKLAETKTNAQGYYTAEFKGPETTNLEVWTVGADGKEVRLSETKFRVGEQQVLNLVAPSGLQQLAPEFDRLSSDIKKELKDLGKLKDAREAADQRDLTLLNRSTGWDARLIAFASTATSLAATTGVEAKALYGLFRVGLPTAPAQLARVSITAVEKALKKASTSGIVKLSDQEIGAATKMFAAFARQQRRAVKAPGTASTYADFVAKAGLSNTELEKFEEAYYAPRRRGDGLWKKVKDAGVPDGKVDALRLQGKLGYLTLNSAELAEALQGGIGTVERLDKLVDEGLYDESNWKAKLRTAASNDDAALQAMIPTAYSGKPEERLDGYAADLARKVRLGFPTQVLGAMIGKDELTLGPRHAALKTPVQRFLKEAKKLDNAFELGRVPLDAFVRDHAAQLFPQNMPPQQVKETVGAVKQVQRVYQITPSNESMKVLLEQGFTAAQDVVAFPYQVFIDRYGHLFPSVEEARLVYRKAEQVAAVTYSFFTAAKQLETAPGVYALSPPAEEREKAKVQLKQHYPTMEALFGSLDFCECEHCRSVLSPAAYLVDLLQFLDHDELVWANFLTDWKNKHGGEAYMKDWTDKPDGSARSEAERKPYDALVERRPDLVHLPLTCENTHTALPYIDLVNEVLEYYVSKGELAAGASHDTGDATTAELLAEPQNVLPDAYQKLKDARYPLDLPFDLWRETVRGFLGYFEVSHSEVLEAFRTNDVLHQSPADPYGRQAVFVESLGLSPSQYAIFTEANPLAEWFKLYGFEGEPEALTQLKSAKELSRRLGVSYKELIQIVKTWFVNPALNALVTLRKLGLEPTDVFRYKNHGSYTPHTADERVAFEQRLDDLSATYSSSGFDARAWLDQQWQANAFNDIVVLADPNTGCNFDATTVRYADGRDADAIVFHKVNLLVRLWRALGWTLEETDRALQVFIPSNLQPLTAANLGAGLRSAITYIAHLAEAEKRLDLGRGARTKLTTLWSNLSTRGEGSLYGQLFLTPGALKNAPEFDHPLGNYLSDPAQLVKDHVLAVQAATGLTSEDVTRILRDQGLDPAAASLNLEVVSALYRYGLLARALQLSVRDLVALRSLSGRDPFKQLDPNELTSMSKDYPFVHTIEFLDIVTLLRETGLRVTDLEYLVQHVVDAVGEYRSNESGLLDLYGRISASLRRIDVDHPLPEDALSVSDEALRQKLELVLEPDAVGTFLGMWTRVDPKTPGIVGWSASESGVAPGNALDPTDFENDDDVEVRYDDARQTQHLTYRGALVTARTNALKAAHPSALFARLLDGVDAQARGFFAQYFVTSGFFQPGDYDVLFGADEAARRNRLLDGLIPFVRRRLKTQQIVQTLVAELASDQELVESLITRPDLVSEPGQAGVPLRDAFLAAGQLGTSARFYASADASGNPLASELVSSIRADSRVADDSGRVARPAGTNSADFEGLLEVPVTGAYSFFATTAAGTGEAELVFDHLVDPVLRGPTGQGGGVVELRAGVPHKFRLRLTKLADAAFALDVQGQGTARGNIGGFTIFPTTSVDRTARAYTIVSKAVLLANRLGLSEQEVRHVLTHPADFGNIDLSSLPTTEDEAVGPAQFAAIRPLLEYSVLKQKLGGTDDLVEVFRRARSSHPPSADADAAKAKLATDVFALFAELSRREASTIRDAANALGLKPTHSQTGTEVRVEFPAFVSVKALARLWQLLDLTGKLGASPSDAASWSTPSPDFETAQNLKNTLRAKFEPDAWMRVSQSVFDKLRGRQRDALVAFVNQMPSFKKYFEGKDNLAPLHKVYEYFLIDAGMEPVVHTSRLLLATAAVQLFIQRCLLNLESRVHASTINAKHWQWMKRYRVWEANRKIWLFPENWLEPEFRNDKTHLFEELEGSLLQEDVSQETAEDAFFNYLKKLEVLARLEIVSMYCEEVPLDPNSNTLHVIGRTYNQPYKYFYRRYAHQMWTPWLPVDAEIEGDHVATVMWRGRLHLFWVTFLEKADDDSGSNDTPRDMADKKKSQLKPAREVQVQLSWTEYSEGSWSTREGGGFGALTKKLGKSFDPSSVFVHVSKEFDGDVERAVRIHLSAPIGKAFRVVSKNAAPEVKASGTPQELPYSWDSRHVTQHRGSNALEVTYVEKIVTEDGKVPESTSATKGVLRKGGNFGLLGCGNPVSLPTDEIGALISPFFYQDNRHTFFVEPTFDEVTIEQWEEWVIPLPDPKPELDEDWWWEVIPVDPFIPVWPPIPPLGPEDPGWIDPLPEILESLDPGSLFPVQPGRDWATDPSTILKFDEGFIGRGGSVDPVVRDHIAAGATPSVLVDVDAGGEVSIHGATGGRVLSDEVNAAIASATITGAAVMVGNVRPALGADRLTVGGGALNVITDAGLSVGALSNLGANLNSPDGFGGGGPNRPL